MGTAIILITHDMGVIAEVTQRVVVMYAGHKVEEGPVQQIINQPQHPNTRWCPRFEPAGWTLPLPAAMLQNIDTLQ